MGSGISEPKNSSVLPKSKSVNGSNMFYYTICCSICSSTIYKRSSKFSYCSIYDKNWMLSPESNYYAYLAILPSSISSVINL